MDDLLRALWDDYKQRPEVGVTREDVYRMIESIAGPEVLDQFSTMVETTQDINFDMAFKRMGCELMWAENSGPWLGVEWEWSGDRAIARTVLLDSPAHRAGVNAGDEIIFLNGYRFLREDAEKISTLLLVDKPYEFIASRLGKLVRLEVIPTKGPKILKEIRVLDRALAEKTFSFSGVPSR